MVKTLAAAAAHLLISRLSRPASPLEERTIARGDREGPAAFKSRPPHPAAWERPHGREPCCGAGHEGAQDPSRSRARQANGSISFLHHDTIDRGMLAPLGAPRRSDSGAAGALAPGPSSRENGSSARALTMAAPADVIRATVSNRVDHPVRHWRITATADGAAPEPFCPLSRVAARTRFLTRSEHPRRRRPRQYHRRRTRFSTPTNPGRNRSRSEARPVSRLYAPVETRQPGRGPARRHRLSAGSRTTDGQCLVAVAAHLLISDSAVPSRARNIAQAIEKVRQPSNPGLSTLRRGEDPTPVNLAAALAMSGARHSSSISTHKPAATRSPVHGTIDFAACTTRSPVRRASSLSSSSRLGRFRTWLSHPRIGFAKPELR